MVGLMRMVLYMLVVVMVQMVLVTVRRIVRQGL